MLTIPPSARPYSAPKLLFTTRNSWTASCGGVARCTPLMVLTKSAPSTVISLLNERMPPKEICVTSNSVKVVPRLVRLVATLGVSRAKSVKSRPLIGKSCDLLGLDHLADFGSRGFHRRRLGGDHDDLAGRRPPST